MGTWSSPDTEEQALKLKTLMQNPLPAKAAEDELYHMMGDDDLFDQIGALKSDTLYKDDVRKLVKDKLDYFACQLDRKNWMRPWSMAALKVALEILEIEDAKPVNPDSMHGWYFDKKKELGYIEHEDPTVRFVQTFPEDTRPKLLTDLKAYGRVANTVSTGMDNAKRHLANAGCKADQAAENPETGDVKNIILSGIDEAIAELRRARDIAENMDYPTIPETE